MPFVIGADLQKRLRVYGTAGVLLMASGNETKTRNPHRTETLISFLPGALDDD